MDIKAKYGRWNTSNITSVINGETSVFCTCDCGTEKYVNRYNLTHSISTCCGCIRRENMAKRNKSHGLSRTTEYSSWLSMKQRCNSSSNKSYHNYGGRGIKVCDEWNNSFESFISDMGNKPTVKHTIERVDNNKGYSPDNCIWDTRYSQARNNRGNRMITYNGKTMCMTDWEKSLNMKAGTFKTRIYKGWSIERAITQPVNSK